MDALSHASIYPVHSFIHSSPCLDEGVVGYLDDVLGRLPLYVLKSAVLPLGGSIF